MAKLIVLEGLDGSGKGTNARLLQAYLEQKHLPVQKISFPDYDQPSSTLVKMYLSGAFGEKPGDVNAYAASMFSAADRYASYKTHWREAYQAGQIILADRYTSSNACHQMSKLPPEKWDEFLTWLEDFEYNKLELPRPDAVLYLDMLPEISQRLLSGRYHGDEQKKDIHEKDTAYLAACRKGALYAAEKLGWRMVRLYEGDAPRSVEENFEQIKQIVEEVL